MPVKLLWLCAALLLSTPSLNATFSGFHYALCPLDASPTQPVYLPHTHDCGRFLQCANGVAYVQQCPENLHWHAQRRVCDYPERVDCQQQKQQQQQRHLRSQETADCIPERFYAHEKHCNKFYYCQAGRKVCRSCAAGFHWHQAAQRCDTPEVAKCATARPARQPPVLNGAMNAACPLQPANPRKATHLPHPDDCTRYLKCAHGRAWIMECPRGLLWSVARNRCDYAFFVQCTTEANEAMTDGGDDDDDDDDNEFEYDSDPVDDNDLEAVSVGRSTTRIVNTAETTAAPTIQSGKIVATPTTNTLSTTTQLAAAEFATTTTTSAPVTWPMTTLMVNTTMETQKSTIDSVYDADGDDGVRPAVPTTNTDVIKTTMDIVNATIINNISEMPIAVFTISSSAADSATISQVAANNAPTEPLPMATTANIKGNNNVELLQQFGLTSSKHISKPINISNASDIDNVNEVDNVTNNLLGTTKVSGIVTTTIQAAKPTDLPTSIIGQYYADDTDVDNLRDNLLAPATASTIVEALEQYDVETTTPSTVNINNANDNVNAIDNVRPDLIGTTKVSGIVKTTDQPAGPHDTPKSTTNVYYAKDNEGHSAGDDLLIATTANGDTPTSTTNVYYAKDNEGHSAGADLLIATTANGDTPTSTTNVYYAKDNEGHSAGNDLLIATTANTIVKRTKQTTPKNTINAYHAYHSENNVDNIADDFLTTTTANIIVKPTMPATKQSEKSMSTIDMYYADNNALDNVRDNLLTTATGNTIVKPTMPATKQSETSIATTNMHNTNNNLLENVRDDLFGSASTSTSIVKPTMPATMSTINRYYANNNNHKGQHEKDNFPVTTTAAGRTIVDMLQQLQNTIQTVAPREPAISTTDAYNANDNEDDNVTNDSRVTAITGATGKTTMQPAKPSDPPTHISSAKYGNDNAIGSATKTTNNIVAVAGVDSAQSTSRYAGEVPQVSSTAVPKTTKPTTIAPATTKMSGSTQDPRLPFRAPQCVGVNNRVRFAATDCQQYHQCFKGFAYRLNCYAGYAFSTSAAKCVPSAAAGC